MIQVETRQTTVTVDSLVSSGCQSVTPRQRRATLSVCRRNAPRTFPPLCPHEAKGEVHHREGGLGVEGHVGLAA